MPFCVPLAEMLGVAPGKPKARLVWAKGVVDSWLLASTKDLSTSAEPMM
jgi:hypothetical protein